MAVGKEICYLSYIFLGKESARQVAKLVTKISFGENIFEFVKNLFSEIWCWLFGENIYF